MVIWYRIVKIRLCKKQEEVNKMEWFKRRKKSKGRSWEDITSPKDAEPWEGNYEAETEDGTTDNTEHTNNSPDNTEHKEEASEKNTEKSSKAYKKMSQKIENLEFDPSAYYDWGDGKFDAFMKRLTNAWFVLASIVWFLLGSITFAPILFMSNKFNKFFDDKTKSFIASLILYFVIVVIIVLIVAF